MIVSCSKGSFETIYQYALQILYALKIYRFFFLNMPGRSLSVLLMILSGVCFVAMHSAAKYLADEVHIFEIVFLRCALVVVILSPFLFKEGKKSLFTKQPKNQIYRIVTNSIAILLFFYGLSISPLSLATVLNFTAPIFTVIFAVTISLYAGVGMMPATFAAAYPYLEKINFVQFLLIFIYCCERNNSANTAE